MDILIIWRAEPKNISACPLNWAFLIKVHHSGNGDTLPTDKPQGRIQEMFPEFHGLIGEPTYIYSKKARQANF